MNMQNQFFIAASFSLVLAGLAVAQEEQPVAVATDQAGESQTNNVQQKVQQQAIVDAVVQEIENQGGSIVPPLEASPNLRHEQFSAPAEQGRPPQPQDRDLGQRRWQQKEQVQRQFERFNAGRPKMRGPRPESNLRTELPFGGHMAEGPQRQQESAKSRKLLDVSWQLQETAHRLEIEGLYEEADAVREAASMLRESSRALAGEEKNKQNKRQDRENRPIREPNPGLRY